MKKRERQGILNSEVACLRQQIAEEYEAGIYGLSGLASGTSRHQYIHQRSHNLLQYLKQLEKVVGPEETRRIFSETLEPL